MFRQKEVPNFDNLVKGDATINAANTINTLIMKNIIVKDADKLLSTEMQKIRGGVSAPVTGCKKCDSKCVRRRK